MDDPITVQAVRQVLAQFQDGYTHRDLSQLDAFMKLFVPDDDLEVIGTNASDTGVGEWCLGPAAVRALVEGDWQGWGDLRLDVEGAKIHSLGDVAWLATSATVSMRLETQSQYQQYLEYLPELAQVPGRTPEARVLRILLGCARTVFELHQGEDFIWPLRFTAVLVLREGRWRFHQMQFSFPTTTYPDERILLDEH